MTIAMAWWGWLLIGLAAWIGAGTLLVFFNYRFWTHIDQIDYRKDDNG